MKLHEFFDTSLSDTNQTIPQHQAEIKQDMQDRNVHVDRLQDIMNLYKVDADSASHLLDIEAQKARKRINDLENEKNKEVENAERERVLQLVRAISDISEYEESQLVVDELVSQYMRGKK